MSAILGGADEVGAAEAEVRQKLPIARIFKIEEYMMVFVKVLISVRG